MKKTKGFTLIELLVVVAIIALLIAVLLPSLASARESAKAAACATYLKSFGQGFAIHASQDKKGRYSTGAFDHLRDGDVRQFGWVADIINLNVGTPGQMLCPANRWTINEKVADYTGAATTGAANPNRPHPVPIVPAADSKEFWANGYNSNYTTTWHFSRGDPTAADGYGPNGDTSDPTKSPLDGDGPLSERHLEGSVVTPNRIAVMGDSRAGNQTDSRVTSAYASTINTFAGEEVVLTGDFTVESFTDGMSVDYSVVTGDPGRKGHEFNDIWPLHKMNGKGVGGNANILFADGHAAAISDTGGLNDAPDGWIGPFQGGSSFQINTSAFDEVISDVWYGRIRPTAQAGGGSIE